MYVSSLFVIVMVNVLLLTLLLSFISFTLVVSFLRRVVNSVASVFGLWNGCFLVLISEMLRSGMNSVVGLVVDDSLCAIRWFSFVYFFGVVRINVMDGLCLYSVCPVNCGGMFLWVPKLTMFRVPSEMTWGMFVWFVVFSCLGLVERMLLMRLLHSFVVVVLSMLVRKLFVVSVFSARLPVLVVWKTSIL